MPQCPNCSYILVLLSARMKYKCAKCSKLFPQKYIDNKEFRYWNKRQRLTDIENIKPKPRIKLSDEEKKLRNEKYFEKWRQKNREKIRAKARENWHIRKQYFKEYYRKDIKHSRLLKRIKYWRTRQKALALREIENIEENAYNNSIFTSPLT